MPKLQLVYDVRRAPFCPVDHGTLYRTMLDQCAWADGLGFDAVMLGEHPGYPDGYVPTPLILAAAVAEPEVRPMGHRAVLRSGAGVPRRGAGGPRSRQRWAHQTGDRRRLRAQ